MVIKDIARSAVWGIPCRDSRPGAAVEADLAGVPNGKTKRPFGYARR
jgi:hypothetical protein